MRLYYQNGYHDEFKKDPNVDPNVKARYKSALKQALDIRKFEIEMYWKRATYFWTFISVIYGGYFYLVKDLESSAVLKTLNYARIYSTLKVIDNIEEKATIEKQLSLISSSQDAYSALLLIAAIGFLFSLSWYCVNRGSKFWQNNWEGHVDLLEDSVHGPLYKLVVFKKPKRFHPTRAYPFSVSKINQSLSLFITSVSAVLLVKEIERFFSQGLPNNDFILAGVFLIIVFGFAIKILFSDSSLKINKSCVIMNNNDMIIKRDINI